MEWFLYDNGLRHERLNQIMKLKETELLIQAAFKFCMVLQTYRKPHQKPALNKSY